MIVGIVIADSEEFSPFCDFALANGGAKGVRHGRNCVEAEYNGNRLLAVECGIGKVNAATASAYLIAEEKPDMIANIGLSGAVSGLVRGDIVVGEGFAECDFDLTALNYPQGQKPGEEREIAADKTLVDAALSVGGVKAAKLGTGDIFLTRSDLKKFYREQFHINSFDMETAAIASVCKYSEIPFLSIRKISDDADDSSAETYTEMNNRREDHLTNVLLEVLEKLK